MEPTQARKHLLAQHDQLRALLERAERIATAVNGGSALPLELRDVLQLCRDSFEAHNASELQLLIPILQRDFAWGQARIDRMVEEHRSEHDRIRATLTGHERDVVTRVKELREMVEAHMAAEERTFLSRSVLRDDIITVEGAG